MNGDLEQAIGLIEKRSYESALSALIDAWRALRLPAIADAVERLDALVGASAFADSAEAWSVAARAAADVARGPLIRAVSEMKRKQPIEDALALMVDWDDPRVGSLVIDLLRELRFTGAVSRTFWRDVIALIPRLNDVRFIELSESLPAIWSVGEDLRRYLKNRLCAASAELVAPEPLMSQDAAAIEQLRAMLAEHEKASARAARAGGSAASGDELLAQIYENPHEDEPRAVYADWLLERGDPRGELITLQLRPDFESDKQAKKRVKELLKAHKKKWLGRIAPMLGGALEFRRGFVAVATAKFRNQKDVEQYGSLPEWSTLEQIECGGPNVRGDQLEWGHWVGPSMRHVNVLISPMSKHLVADDVCWQLEQLTLKGYPAGLVTAEDYRRILASPQLPRLRQVLLAGSPFEPAWLEGVTRCPATLGVNRAIERSAGWIAAAERTEAEQLVFDWYGISNTFSRDERGRFTRLDAVIVPPTKAKTLNPWPRPLAQLIEGLGALEPGSLTHFSAEILIGGKLVPATPALNAAARLLA
jgi:uncharacterized protein (TIGR02996 family)